MDQQPNLRLLLNFILFFSVIIVSIMFTSRHMRLSFIRHLIHGFEQQQQVLLQQVNQQY